ncbi:uncharacterized protein B0T23DRAFT_408841 [Neurospora hispaniola]|uniref:Uncharacterized protein n=1 Tax=Neurospora hispaniola TaxID=588809 RepID=A0AAJ0MLE5_9PEZI|nr:hypothetical protein B0T23DRAFT_408841 [Neurospora hispaniola]
MYLLQFWTISGNQSLYRRRTTAIPPSFSLHHRLHIYTLEVNMTEPESFNRPGSAAAAAARYFTTSSPRPSVASRTSRSSLRREHDVQTDQLQPQSRRLSSAQSHSPSPQPPPSVEEHTLPGIDQQQQPQQQKGEEGREEGGGSQPSFTPFFTLLSSSTHSSQRQTIHHPTVHYVFADDDPDILTAALAYHHQERSEQDAPPSPDNDERLYNKEPRDRAVILDVAPSSNGNGLQVAWASSLSSDWAVVSAQVMRMEDQASSGSANAAGGVFAASSPSLHTGPSMLKIEGIAIDPSSSSSSLLSSSRLGSGGKLSSTPEGDLQSSLTGKGKQATMAPPAPEDYAALLQDFERRIGVLKRVAEAGSERQRRISSMDNQGFERNHGGGGASGKGDKLLAEVREGDDLRAQD